MNEKIYTELEFYSSSFRRALKRSQIDLPRFWKKVSETMERMFSSKYAVVAMTPIGRYALKKKMEADEEVRRKARLV